MKTKTRLNPLKLRRGVWRPKAVARCLLCLTLVLWGFHAFGEEWSDAQKEVWEIVEASWEYITQGDVEKLMALERTEESLEWWSGQAVPLWVKSIEQLYMSWLAYDQPNVYELTPLRVQIVDPVANVFFQWRWEGETASESGRQLSTYLKQDGKWKFMGGMGCRCDELPYCMRR